MITTLNKWPTYLPYLAHQAGYQRFRVTSGALQRYIQTEMEFLDISSLGTAYRYDVKIEQKLKQKTRNLGLGTPHRKSQELEAPTHRTKDRENMDSIRTTNPSRK
jgi:hypothetical protein